MISSWKDSSTRTSPFRRIVSICVIILAGFYPLIHPISRLHAAPEPGAPEEPPGMIYYVRQTVGNDQFDGRSPERAWRHLRKLSQVMQAGDTAYIGPGLYREGMSIQADGTAARRIPSLNPLTF